MLFSSVDSDQGIAMQTVLGEAPDVKRCLSMNGKMVRDSLQKLRNAIELVHTLAKSYGKAQSLGQILQIRDKWKRKRDASTIHSETTRL